LAIAVVLALLVGLLIAATATAAAKPGKPTPVAPKGKITTAKPTFSWTKARRATTYQLRVYQGTTLLLKKSGITRLRWKSTRALPEDVTLAWKVRGRNASGFGAWSRRVRFRIVLPSSEKAITSFAFFGLAPPVAGTIDETAHTIAATVPFGTNVTALVATFTTTGASVSVAGTPQVSGATANDFSNPVTYTVTAANGTTQAYVVTVTKAASPAKAITAYSFEGLSPPVDGTINESSHKIAVDVPFGTDVTDLVATFATTGASVSVAGTAQVSGVTANDFSNPVTYTVTAADGTTQAYVVTVKVAASAAKQMTAFSFQDLTPAVNGTIDQSDRAISLTVPYGTSLAARVATFTVSAGASVSVGGTPQVSGVTVNSFTNPLTYLVTAADGSTRSYLVTVTVASSPEKEITAFSFQGLTPAVTGLISQTAHTIGLTVPPATDVTTLVATFTTSAGASVTVGGTTQTSGATVNDFSNLVTYTVRAADGTTQTYAVTVYYIGKAYQGGKIAYILKSGDPGFVANETHGLIAAVSDEPLHWYWSNVTNLQVPDGTSTNLGAGMANTIAITKQSTSGAAEQCLTFESGSYTDWYLPSYEELNKLYLNQAHIGGFSMTPYWTSSEAPNKALDAWAQDFTGGAQLAIPKGVSQLHVRSVRSF
jgi:hypothetical protein